MTKQEIKVNEIVNIESAITRGYFEDFKVLGVQDPTEDDEDFGVQKVAWVERIAHKDGFQNVTLALFYENEGWMYDDTWSDFCFDQEEHPYAESLKYAGYRIEKIELNSHDTYWNVVKDN